MKDNSKAQIYLAAERGHTETEWFRSYNTFNFGGFQQAHTKGFGPLCLLNDDTLAGGKSITLTTEDVIQLILLPSVGTVVYTDNHNNIFSVEAGQALIIHLTSGTTFQLQNPYENELINFLQFWCKTNDTSIAPQLCSFDLQSHQNSFITLAKENTQLAAPIFLIGKFDGRNEAALRNQVDGGSFFFIIQGAFEVANRLLESRDGLGLWQTTKTEMEALSNEAIIVVIQLPTL